MLLTALLLSFTTLAADTPRTAPTPPAAAVEAIPSTDAPASAETKPEKPDAPSPKIVASNSESDSVPEPGAASSSSSALRTPVKPASNKTYETPRKRAIWYGLMAAGHGTAAFDAWTTRRAVTSGYGVESDPFQRPFANSNAIYATTQVTPLAMDFVGHYMMRSRYPLVRRFWWIPQTASASFSLGAGIHNYRVVH